ncbi:MAG: cupin domain-containing protein [Actinomycetota bacterium]|jgi:anti-sigma factor ChrR (cupin superfamily)
MKEMVLDSADVAARAWMPIADWPGVDAKTLWEDARTGSYGGLMRLAAGSSVPAHTHRYSVHHVWVIEGECTMLGRKLGPGSYCFSPAGIAHSVDPSQQGCTVFYLYLRADMD